MEIVVSRCAALDVHKNTVMACVRVPGRDGERVQQVRQFRTFTSQLRRLRAWLAESAVSQVAMEGTSVIRRADMKKLDVAQVALWRTRL